MRVAFVRPGRDGLAWLGEQLPELKQGDALAPVTIVVPNYLSGRFAGRVLAREHGWVNLRFSRLADVAIARRSPSGLTATAARAACTPMR